MTLRRTALVLLAGLALTVPLAVPVAAAPARAVGTRLSLPPLVTLQARTVHGGDPAHAAGTSRPEVTAVRGLPAGAARAVAADLTAEGRRLVAAATQAKTTVTVFFQVAEQDRRYVTVLVETSTYGEGAAHPYTAPSTATYERATGRRLRAADLFAPAARTRALQVLSRESRRLLPVQLGEGYDAMSVADGTRPTPENFAALVPRPMGLEVVFAPYQVAAYVFGQPSVVIAWSALSGLLARPLPETTAPLPPYSGGRPDVEAADLRELLGVLMTTRRPGLTGRAPGSFRLEDVRYTEATRTSSDGSFQGSADYVLLRLVPLAAPAAALTVALRSDSTSYGTRRPYRVFDVQHGAAGCRAFPPSVLRQLRAGCR